VHKVIYDSNNNPIDIWICDICKENESYNNMVHFKNDKSYCDSCYNQGRHLVI